ncbi:hypothetical protein D3C87_1568300 [compost metagenome]
MGSIDTAGNACEYAPGSYEAQEIQEGSDRYRIPTSVYVKKDEGRMVARGACTFALNIKAARGKKIQVSNSYQMASLRAYPENTRVKAELEIFRDGTQGEKSILIVEAEGRSERVVDGLGSAEILAESECGGAAILRGNLAITAIGKGKVRAFTRDLYLDIREVSCQ